MNTSPQIEFRTAAASDAESITKVLDVFGAGHGAAHRPSVCAQPHQWRVGLEGSDIACALRAAPSELWIGKSRLKSADIGEVAVAARHQGLGIGSLAMADCNRWLRESGYAIARLGGLMRFYGRFGYEPFPRCYVEFPISDTIRAGAARIGFASLLAPSPAGAGCVRAYDAATDFESVCDLIDGFTRGHTGSRVFQWSAHALEDFSGWLVYEDAAARLRGAMRCSQHETDVTPFESKVMISGFAYEAGHAPALEALVKHALRLAHQCGSARMTAYLPQRSALIDDLHQTGLDFTLCAHNGGVAGNMVRVVSLTGLLKSVRPELEKRLAGNETSTALKIDIGNERAGLRVHGSVLTVEEAQDGTDDGAEAIHFTHRDLLAALLGIAPHGRVASGEVQGLLNRIFPAGRGSYIT